MERTGGLPETSESMNLLMHRCLSSKRPLARPALACSDGAPRKGVHAAAFDHDVDCRAAPWFVDPTIEELACGVMTEV
jgi:hypothetical protein